MALESFIQKWYRVVVWFILMFHLHFTAHKQSKSTCKIATAAHCCCGVHSLAEVSGWGDLTVSKYRRSCLLWHRLQWHSVGPSGYSDTFLISQLTNLIVKFSRLQWHSASHLLTVTLFCHSWGCHCNRLPLYLVLVPMRTRYFATACVCSGKEELRLCMRSRLESCDTDGHSVDCARQWIWGWDDKILGALDL